jgi:lactate permease
MGTTDSSTGDTKSASGQKPASASSVVWILLGILALALGTVYLLKTNPATGKWAQAYDPTGHWWLSTIVAALPVFVLLGAMALLRMKAHVAAVWGLLTALTIAIVVYHMPVRLALTTTAFGAGYRAAGEPDEHYR